MKQRCILPLRSFRSSEATQLQAGRHHRRHRGGRRPPHRLLSHMPRGQAQAHGNQAREQLRDVFINVVL